MKRYTFNPRLGVMVESQTGEWVMHDSVAAHVAYRIKVARLQSMCRPVRGPEPREALPVALLPLDAPGEGVDIDRCHRRYGAVEPQT